VSSSPKQLKYGPVLILKGPHKGRIGYYDDDDVKAIVYFGSMFFARDWYEISHSYLRQANTEDLLKRSEAIYRELGFQSGSDTAIEEKYDLLLERHYVDGILAENYINVRFEREQALKGARVFLSHSSKDKWFVRRIATDLKRAGVIPWVDEWQIRAGESIPQKVSDGIKDSDCIIVVLSKNAIESKWVEREWQTKYWDEIQRDRVLVIPVLIEDCKIPELLKTKKYADFREDYNDGLTDLLLAMPRNSSGSQ
jgi:hypothetical protein